MLPNVQAPLAAAGIESIDTEAVPSVWSSRDDFWSFSCREAAVVVVIASESYWASEACLHEFEIAAAADGDRLFFFFFLLYA